MTPVVIGFVRASAPTLPRAGSPATTYTASAIASAPPTRTSRPRSFKKVEYQSRAPVIPARRRHLGLHPHRGAAAPQEDGPGLRGSGDRSPRPRVGRTAGVPARGVHQAG